MRRWPWVLALCLIVTACNEPAGRAGIPDYSELESCNSAEFEIYMPVLQGPAYARAASRAAIDCILDAHTALQIREAEFVLLGDLAPGERAIVQTLPDGSVNYYVYTDRWVAKEGCQSLSVSWYFTVSECS